MEILSEVRELLDGTEGSISFILPALLDSARFSRFLF